MVREPRFIASPVSTAIHSLFPPLASIAIRHAQMRGRLCHDDAAERPTVAIGSRGQSGERAVPLCEVTARLIRSMRC